MVDTSSSEHPRFARRAAGTLTVPWDQTVCRYCREEIFLPLGMSETFIGMDKPTFDVLNKQGLFAELRTMSPKGKILTKATVGTSFNEVTACVPGSNMRGPAHQCLCLFDMLVNEGVSSEGVRLLRPETVRKMTKRHRIGMYDVVQGVVCDWSLGLFVGSSLTGEHSSSEAYGHGGSQSSMGFCDPEHKLAAVVFCNTRPGPKHHYERMAAISTAIYEDLGLTGLGLKSPPHAGLLSPSAAPATPSPPQHPPPPASRPAASSPTLASLARPGGVSGGFGGGRAYAMTGALAPATPSSQQWTASNYGTCSSPVPGMPGTKMGSMLTGSGLSTAEGGELGGGMNAAAVRAACSARVPTFVGRAAGPNTAGAMGISVLNGGNGASSLPCGSVFPRRAVSARSADERPMELPE